MASSKDESFKVSSGLDRSHGPGSAPDHGGIGINMGLVKCLGACPADLYFSAFVLFVANPSAESRRIGHRPAGFGLASPRLPRHQ